MLEVHKLSFGQFNYLLRQQAVDYYTNGGEPLGHYYGRGAKELRLEGPIKDQHYHNLFHGLSPDGQRSFRQKQRYVKRHAGCGKVRQQQAGWDCILAVPKSVTAAWTVGSAEVRRLIDRAIDTATHRTLDFLEERTGWTRRGQGGKYRERAYLIIAVFPHSTARSMADSAADPHQHRHCVVMNYCLRADGSTGTLDSRGLYQHKMAAGAYFRAVLAQDLEGIGFKCEPDGTSFKIVGIPDALCVYWSKRSRAIRQRMAELGLHTAAEATEIAMGTRQAKGQVPPREQLLRRWQAEAEPFGVTPAVIDVLLRPSQLPEQDRRNRPDAAQVAKAIDSAVEVVAANYDTFTSREVVTRVLNKSIGTGLDPQVAIKATEERLKIGKPCIPVSPAAADRDAVYTSRRARLLEYDVVTRICSLSRDQRFILSDKRVERTIQRFSRPRNPLVEEAKYHLSQLGKAIRAQKTQRINRPLLVRQARQRLNIPGQVLVRRLTQQRGRIVILNEAETEQRNLAIRAATRCWRKAGYQVIAATPYRRTKQRLEEETGLPTVTHRHLQLKLHSRLTYRLRHHARQLARAAMKRPTYKLKDLRIDRSKILLVDRAHTLGLRELSQLVRDVERHGGKLILLAPRAAELPAGYINMTARLLDRLPGQLPQDISLYHIRQAQEQMRQPQLHVEGR